MHIGGSRGEGGTIKVDIFSVGCLPKADTRRQGEGGGVKNPILRRRRLWMFPYYKHKIIDKSVVTQSGQSVIQIVED